MPNLSLTDLVDVFSRNGISKATKVAEIKNRKSYNPAVDFYKPLRDGLIKISRNNEPKISLDNLLDTISDPKKISNYAEAIEGYKKWWGRKQIGWFDPLRTTYTHNSVGVSINPELGLYINGSKHVVKLYLKSDPLTKLRIDLITGLMEISLRPQCVDGEKLALLDVRQARLFIASESIKPTKAIVDAELAYIASLWPNI